MDTTVADTLVGRVLDGRYRIQQRIARGGMATVYRALDERLDRPVAVKVMHAALAEDPDFVTRFTREAKAAARLSHPHVVAVFDQGSDGGVVFLVMEYVDGSTLRDVIRERGRLSPRQALDVVAPVLSALTAAHDAGIVHRDIKPENVLIASNGRIKVADFGLARAIAASQTTATTGLLIGTAAYLAPEQIEHGTADPRTDLYATGIMLYELLVGRAPYEGPTPMAVVFKHVHERVPAPSLARPGIPPAVDALVLDATQREPAERPPTALELLGQLEAAARSMPPEALDLTQPTVVLGEHHTTVLHREPGPAKTLVGPNQPARTLVAPTGPPSRPPVVPADTHRRRPWLHGWRIAVLLLVLVTVLAAAGGAYLGLHDQLFGNKTNGGTGGASSAGTSAASQAPLTATVPDFAGLTKEQADAKAAENHLAPPTYGEAQWSDSYKLDTVMSQDVGAGQSIDRTVSVQLILSKGPQLFPVPANLVGMSLDEAKKALQAVNLDLGKHPSQWHDSKAGTVLSITTPVPPDGLPRGAKVDVTASKGPQPIAVNDEKGKSSDAAQQDLKGQGFTNVTTSKDYSDTVAEGDVISQSVDAGKAVVPGTAINLVISKGQQLFEVPNLFGMTVTEARNELAKYGMTAKVRDLRGGANEHVLSQTPSAKTLHTHGTVVTIKIF